MKLIQKSLRWKVNNTISFVNWSPCPLKYNIYSKPPTFVPGGSLYQGDKSVWMLANKMGIGRIFKRIREVNEQVLIKGAFAFWYIAEGMEQGEIDEALEDIAALEKDYQGLGGEEEY